MPLSTNIKALIAGDFTGTAGMSTPLDSLAYALTLTLTDGTGSGNANQRWLSYGRTLAASASENLDLNGSLTNAFGTTTAFTQVKALAIFAYAANTNDIVVGNAASNGFISWLGSATDKITIRPGGFMLLTAPQTGYTVTAATADQLKVLNNGAGTGVTYDIAVIGVG